MLSGRYGPYVTDGSVNATLPKGTEPEDIDLDTAVEMLAEKARAKGGKKGGRRRDEEMSRPVTVVGGGLAGCEAAAAARATKVSPFGSWRCGPDAGRPAHQTDLLGELVCTNSFKSEAPDNAHGQLKREMAALGSVLLRSAHAGPGGGRLRARRGSAPLLRGDDGRRGVRASIEVVREECAERAGRARGGRHRAAHVRRPVARRSRALLGDDGLAFFDAIAPIVHRDSLDDVGRVRGGALRRGRRLSELSDEPRGVRGVRERAAGRRGARGTRLGRGALLRGVPADRGDGDPRRRTRCASGP